MAEHKVTSSLEGQKLIQDVLEEYEKRTKCVHNYFKKVLVQSLKDFLVDYSSQSSVSSTDSSPRPSFVVESVSVEEDIFNSPTLLTTNMNDNSRQTQLPTFDGITSWTLFHAQFNAAAELNHWSYSERSNQLILALRGPALEYLKEVDPSQSKHCFALLKILERKFGEAHNETRMNRAILRSRLQETFESLRDFGSAIQRLAHIAYPNAPNELQEYLAIQAFIDGLQDPEISKALILKEHIYLESAIQHAIKLKANQDSVECFQQMNRTRRSNAMQNLMSTINSDGVGLHQSTNETRMREQSNSMDQSRKMKPAQDWKQHNRRPEERKNSGVTCNDFPRYYIM